MIKQLTVTLALCLLWFQGFPQGAPVRHWDVRFGGIDEELLIAQVHATDGGLLLAGSSYSDISGDKTQSSRGGADFWIVKVDSGGLKQWDKRYGGNADDRLMSVQQTQDGGYILGGFTESTNSGDITHASRGSMDYWIVKVTGTGVIEWDARFGGSGNEELFTVLQTPDGGYLLGGFSDSGISGDKTQPSKGGSDYWLVKVSDTGTKEWDASYGGNSPEFLKAVITAPGGGYLLGGASHSGISGDRTQDSRGEVDFWIVKIDNAGIKQWDARFGGTESDLLDVLIPMVDGGYLLAGMTTSGLSGDKSQPSRGGYDIWIVKVNSAGTKEWDASFGGSNHEEVHAMAETLDGSLILGGISNSPVSGDQSNAPKGATDFWLLKTDSLGNKIWDASFGGSGDDNLYALNQTGSGGLLLAGFSSSGISGDKSQASWGSTDMWLLKTGPVITSTRIEEPGTLVVYPNPFHISFTILLSASKATTAVTWLTDMLGREVHRQHFYSIVGNTSLTITPPPGLARGAYLLQVQVGDQLYKHRLVVE